MTASQKCKKAGLKSFNELSELSGESKSTLHLWYNDRPLRFDLILYAVALKKITDFLNKGK